MVVIRQAAELLEFSGIEELEDALAGMQNPLITLTAAGVLSELVFSLADPQGVCGVQAVFDPSDVADFVTEDLSALRLLANPACPGSLQIACVDGALATAIVGEDWLPPASALLAVSQVSRSGSTAESNVLEEEAHEYGNQHDE